MITENIKCVVLADRHQGLTEGIRGLLETGFDAVVMVADEASLRESAVRLKPAVVVLDLALARTDGLGLLRRLRARCPDVKLIVLSRHEEASTSRATIEAGADAIVLTRAIAIDLLPAVDAVQAGRRFVSPGVRDPVPPGGNKDVPG